MGTSEELVEEQLDTNEVSEVEITEEDVNNDDEVGTIDDISELIEDEPVEQSAKEPDMADLIPVTEINKLEAEFLKNTLIKYEIKNEYSIVRLPVENVIRKLYVKEDAGNGQFNLYEFEDKYIRTTGANGIITTFNLYDIVQLDGMKCMIIGFELNKDYICLSCITKSIGLISIPLEIGNNIYIIDSNDEVRRNLNLKL